MRRLPPMIVRMREACPGQSTKVNCRLSYCCWLPESRSWSGRSTVKEEKPRSSVIPLSRDCGFLSKAAVDAVLLRALASDVFPLSTCPSTPMLKLSVLMWLSVESDILSNVRSFPQSSLRTGLSINESITLCNEVWTTFRYPGRSRYWKRMDRCSLTKPLAPENAAMSISFQWLGKLQTPTFLFQLVNTRQSSLWCQRTWSSGQYNLAELFSHRSTNKQKTSLFRGWCRWHVHIKVKYHLFFLNDISSLLFFYLHFLPSILNMFSEIVSSTTYKLKHKQPFKKVLAFELLIISMSCL